ncbi:hypothetical protein [Gracilimonas sediminicola]|uniref:hypothetical protein n=1 Tax=Gracilimonas sediminicola TaxID=2952158 RepID=UPI0038D41071
MKERVFAKNPSELQIIENPNKRRSNMAKQSKITTEKAVSEFKQQAITAGYILGGQAVAAQVNALAVPMLTGNASATIQQATRAGIPLTAGVLLTLVTKNKHLRGLAMGMGVQGVMEAIKFVMPDWTPQQGLMDGSGYVYDGVPLVPETTHHVDDVETSMEVSNTIEV